ncbi:MAG: NifU family protein [Bacteroidota bacterium]
MENNNNQAATKRPVMLYTEQTPNPETLKFVTNRMLYRGTADFRTEDLAKEWSPLATELFERSEVKGVYICNNFVTITKEFNYNWDDIMLALKEYIKAYIASEKTIIQDGFAEAMEKLEAKEDAGREYTEDEAVLVAKIKELIETYVKPAVEMDGGNIEFKSFDEGRVSVVLQGACSGCPSSTVTLKAGIEGMLKRMVPEVTEVVAEMG